MNLLHMKYAVAVAETRSLNKAAEELFIGQPALSRAIKELENNLGTILFERTPKGMVPTEEGEVFVECARSILRQVDDVEMIFKDEETQKKRFSFSGPRSGYIGRTFADFSQTLPEDARFLLSYQETNDQEVIKNVVNDVTKLGIVRFAKQYRNSLIQYLDEKGLKVIGEMEFQYRLYVNKKNPLAQKERITFDDLKDMVHVTSSEHYIPSIQKEQLKRDEDMESYRKEILVFDRAEQYDILISNPQAFLWGAPGQAEILRPHGIVQKECEGSERVYLDFVICKKYYHLTDLDEQFLKMLKKAFEREQLD